MLAIASEPPEALGETLFGLDDAGLRRIVALTLARVGIIEPIELSLLVTDDAGLQALNREYRGHDTPTDVLSFPLLDSPLVVAPADQLWQPPGEDGEDGDGPYALAAADVSAAGDSADDDVDYTEYREGAEALIDSATTREVHTEEIAAVADDADDSAFGEERSSAHLHLGDVALSRDAIARQATQGSHSPAYELAYLLAHGLLHLVGFDDTTDAGYVAMVGHQEAVLRDAGITN